MQDFKIPKNLNQQDTIGNFTFPQLGIMGGGFLLILILFGTGMNLILALILSLPIAFLTWVLMYYKRMDLPIYEYAFVYLSYMASPKKMIYRKENKRELLSIREQIFIIEEEEEDKKEEELSLNKKPKKEKRKELKQNKKNNLQRNLEEKKQKENKLPEDLNFKL